MSNNLLAVCCVAAIVAPCTTFHQGAHLAAAPRSAAHPRRSGPGLALAACGGELPVKTEAVWSRRSALRQGAAATGGAWAAFGDSQRLAAESDAAGNRVVPEDNIEFQAKWTYAKAQDILPYIYATAGKGQVDEIIHAMDEFGRHYPMYKLGDEKGAILEREIAQMDAPPKNALELGTFLGYSALRTARRLAPGGKLNCIGFCIPLCSGSALPQRRQSRGSPACVLSSRVQPRPR
jgi:hypothetical protein